MFLTVHALTGMTIGTLTDAPEIIAPAALASHFLIDAMPHLDETEVAGKHIYTLAIIDTLLALSLGVVAALFLPWELASRMILGGFFAALPDAMWGIKYAFNVTLPPWLYRFHYGIQHLESERGWGFEIAWSLFMALILRVRV